jgi:hypothetical protein
LRQKGSELLRKIRQSGLVIKTIIFGWTIFLKSSLLFFATVHALENNKENDDFQPTGHENNQESDDFQPYGNQNNKENDDFHLPYSICQLKQ